MAFPSRLRLPATLFLLASPLLGQVSYYDYTGLNSSSNWTGTNSWVPAVVPQGPEVVVRFGELENKASDRINMLAHSTVWTTTHTAVAGAMVFLPTLDSTATTFLVRNSSTSTPGFLNLHGATVEVGEVEYPNLLIGNFGAPMNIAYSTVNQSFTIQLQNSGVIHVVDGAFLDIRVGITNDGTPRSITKTGDGILRFGPSQGDPYNTYGGGFILEGGIVEWTQSGGRASNPFGANDAPMILRNGTLRSTTSGSRTINVPVHFDGTVTFGSTDPDFNGAIAANSQSGNLRAAVLTDSTIHTLTQFTFHQSIDGTANLTKTGDGALVFSVTSSDNTFTGTLDIAEGRLELNGNLAASPVIVRNGALIAGTGTAGAGVTVEANATLSPGTEIERGTLTTTDLVLEAGAYFATVLEAATVGGFDAVVALDSVSLGGAELVPTLAFAPQVGDVFVLIDNQSGQAMDGLLSHAGTPLAQGEEFTIMSGEFSQLFAIFYDYSEGGFSNSLAIVAVPEPAHVAGLTGLLALALAALRRRRQS